MTFAMESKRAARSCRTGERKLLSRRPKFAFYLTAIALFTLNNLLAFRESSIVSITGTETLHIGKSDGNNWQAYNETESGQANETESGQANETAPLDLVSHSEDAREVSYSEWLLEQKHNLSHHYAMNTVPPFFVKYKTCCGLGHQLTRMAAAYHFSALYGISHLRPLSASCGPKNNVYNHLLGEGQMVPVIPSTKVFFPKGWPEVETANDRTESHNKAWTEISNEVPGYESLHFGHWINHNFYGKHETDFEFYKELMTLFGTRHQERIQGILDETLFAQHTVFGLHIRTGNGEKGNFVRKRRRISNVNKWLQNVGEMLCEYSRVRSDHFKEHPLMIYLGTDTGSVIPKFKSIMKSLSSSENCTNIPVVNAEQVHPKAGSGVSFAQEHQTTTDCLKGWENMFLDQYFFTKCNTVIAGQYSSFTQAAPLSYMMHKKNNKFKKNQYSYRRHPKYFCEVSPDGRKMDCYNDLGSFIMSEKTYSFGDPKARTPRVPRELKFPTSSTTLDLSKYFRGTPIKLKSRK